MTNIDTARIRSVVTKELRDYRRRRSIVAAMIILPVVFLIEPTLTVFVAPAGTNLQVPLLLLLLIPVVTPSTLAAYSIVGEREQGTLEPVLTTPLQREEFIIGKAAAIMIPTLALSYGVFAVFLAVVRLFATSAASRNVFHQGPVLLAVALLTPLLAGWAVIVGMAISVRATEVRVAQQLGMVASFPPLLAVILLSLGVLHPSVQTALLFAGGLLLIDARAVPLVARTFDRERLITGNRAGGRPFGTRRRRHAG